MYLSAYNFAHTPCVSIALLTYSFSTTCKRHVDGLGVQLVPIPLVSSIFIITFSPYLYVYTY